MSGSALKTGVNTNLSLDSQQKNTPITLVDFSSSSCEWYGRGNELETSNVPSKSRPSSTPWAVIEGASYACFMILETTYV